MSEERIKKIKTLIKEGESFDFQKYQHAEYIAWKMKVKNNIFIFFGKSSPIFESFNKADYVPEILDPKIKLIQDRDLLLGNLYGVIDILELDIKMEDSEKKTFEKSNRVFIVHGHDEKMKNQLEIFLSEIGLESVVLHRKPDEGLTIIEKFEKYSDVGYAFILITPDDIGYSLTEDSKPEDKKNKEKRARQNVIFEFGYFVGRLGRRRVCCLYKEGVSLPTDVSGMIYKKVKDNVEEVAFAIQKDLIAVGYKIKV